MNEASDVRRVPLKSTAGFVVGDSLEFAEPRQPPTAPISGLFCGFDRSHLFSAAVSVLAPAPVTKDKGGQWGTREPGGGP
jgi:hypothetical protein